MIWPEELEAMRKTRHEREFLVVDLREEREYLEAHIPGARHVPLRLFMAFLEALEDDVELVLCCQRGSRTKVALLAAGELGDRFRISGLEGGVDAWMGHLSASWPRLHRFPDTHEVGALLDRAMALEKGAGRFYRVLAGHMAKRRLDLFEALFLEMASEEEGHARRAYITGKVGPAADFLTRYEQLEDTLLEDGREVSAVVAGTSSADCEVLLELALEVELAAFDLYRTLADLNAHTDAGTAFMELAQAEKRHMDRLSDAFSLCGTEVSPLT